MPHRRRRRTKIVRLCRLCRRGVGYIGRDIRGGWGAMVRLAWALVILLTALTDALALADGCAVVTVTPDGVLALRSGPGLTYPEVMLLRSGQFVSIDDLAGDSEGRWLHVTGLMEGRARGG